MRYRILPVVLVASVLGSLLVLSARPRHSPIPPQTCCTRTEAAVVDALLADLTARISSATSTALPRDWTPPNDPLIIFAPAYPEPVGTTSYVNSSQPFRAWTVIHGRLVELTNPSDRVAAYTAAIRAAPSQAQWTLYEFGILQVAPDDVTIEVYLSVGCGFNCGHGDRVTFQRAATGHWNQTAITALWIQ